MSEQSYSTDKEHIAALEARLYSLERQLKRQKLARKNAEAFLETYSQDAYLANQALRKALNESKKRERELLYLNRTASQLGDSESSQSFIFSALESAVDFSGASCGKAFIVKDGELIIGVDEQVLTPKSGWVASSDLANLLRSEIPLELTESYSHWCVNVVMRPDSEQEARLLHYMHEIAEDEFAWLVLLTRDDELEEEMLYVLDTTKHYLSFNSRYQSKKTKLNDKKIELRSLKKDRESLEKRLISADKMAMLGQLAAGIAHEINNPIGYVRSNTTVAKEIFDDYQNAINQVAALCEEVGGEFYEKFQGIQEGFSLQESAAEITEIFVESLDGIERIIDIVKALRSFSYPGSRKSEQVSAIEVMNSAIKLTNNLHRYKNHVSLIANDGDATFLGSAGQIQQVLVNFLTNAIYATPEGKHIYLHVEKNDKSVLLTVEDEGVGMPPEVLEKVFTPFFTTKPPGDGTGLGMSISMTIIEEHSGVIEIFSEEGKGTKIVVSLPMSESI